MLFLVNRDDYFCIRILRLEVNVDSHYENDLS